MLWAGLCNDTAAAGNVTPFRPADPPSSTALKTTSVTTSGNQTYGDAVVLDSNTLTANTTLNGVNVSFDSTLDGTTAATQGLTVNASGVTTFGDGTFDDKVGGAKSLSSERRRVGEEWRSRWSRAH